MDKLNFYIEQHIKSNEYKRRLESMTPSFQNRLNWVDHMISHDLIYSHRKTFYTKNTFIDRFHSHDFCEIVIYLSGDVKYLSESREFEPERGDLIISAPGVRHTASLKNQSEYDRCVLYFDTGGFDGFGDCIGTIFDNEAFVRLEKGRDELERIIAMTDKALESDDRSSALKAYSLILSLFCLVIDMGAAAKWQPVTGKAAEIRDYIDRNLTSDLTVAGIAGEFHYSREHLSRLFHKSYNISISDYISDRRLELARRMLWQGKSVTETVYGIGYADASSFIRNFKQKYGMTPLQYVKKHPLGK